MTISDKTGVPVVALLMNFVVGAEFVILLPSWHSLIEVFSALAALTFSIGSVSLNVFRNAGLGDTSTRLRGMNVMAPLAFRVSLSVIFWQDWGPCGRPPFRWLPVWCGSSSVVPAVAATPVTWQAGSD